MPGATNTDVSLGRDARNHKIEWTLVSECCPILRNHKTEWTPLLWTLTESCLDTYGLNIYDMDTYGLDTYGLDTYGLDTYGLDTYGLDIHASSS